MNTNISKSVSWLLIIEDNDLIQQENIPNIAMSHALVAKIHNINPDIITDTGIEYENGSVWFRVLGWI